MQVLTIEGSSVMFWIIDPCLPTGDWHTAKSSDWLDDFWFGWVPRSFWAPIFWSCICFIFLSSLCILLTCSLILSFRLNLFPHSSQTKSFLSECLTMWAFNLSAPVKAFWQTSQWNRFSAWNQVWSLTQFCWLFKIKDWWEKVRF